MIDTDKYEGHSEDEWVFDDEYIVMKNKTGNTRHVKVSQMNMNLMLDAPLLLAEVIRLRSGIQDILVDFETTKTDMWSIIKRIQELIE